MVKVGILSDTHGWLRQEVKQILTSCDCIVHAGDIDTTAAAEQLRAIAPLYMVRGNADAGVELELLEQMHFAIEGVQFTLIHNRRMLEELPESTQVVVYGHTHRYRQQRDARGVLWLNPGCCGKRQLHQEATMMVARLEAGSIQVEKRVLEARSRQDEAAQAGSADLCREIDEIVRRMERGEAMERIAARLHRPVSFVEMVYRIKVTHPGVTSHGIYDKMEANAVIRAWNNNGEGRL